MDERETLSCLASARGGDDAAMAALIADLLPFIRRKASSVAAQSGLEAEDLAQEGLIGLLSAVRTFRSGRGAGFHTYACTCVLNRMRSAMRRVRRAGAIPAGVMVPIDSAVQFPAADDPQDALIAREAAAHLNAWIAAHLSPLEQQVLRLYMVGCSYGSIADKLSLRDAKAVDNAMQRIRKKVKTYPSYAPSSLK